MGKIFRLFLINQKNKKKPIHHHRNETTKSTSQHCSAKSSASVKFYNVYNIYWVLRHPVHDVPTTIEHDAVVRVAFWQASDKISIYRVGRARACTLSVTVDWWTSGVRNAAARRVTYWPRERGQRGVRGEVRRRWWAPPRRGPYGFFFSGQNAERTRDWWSARTIYIIEEVSCARSFASIDVPINNSRWMLYYTNPWQPLPSRCMQSVNHVAYAYS